MPIDVKCDGCGGKFRVPDKFAGKRVKCPKCKESVIEIPSEGGASAQAAAEPAAAEKPAARKPAPDKPQKPAEPDQWYLQTEDGEQYGPVPREELDSWLEEGRIDAACQILREGWDQWKWAEDVYTQLAETTSPVVPVTENPFVGIGDAAAPAAAENPFVAPETTEPVTAVADTGEGGGLTPGSRTALQQTKPWVTFLAIVGFVVGGLGALGGLISIAMLSLGLGFRGALMGLMAFIGPAVTLVASYYLFTYGQRIYIYLRSNQPKDLEGALVAQKSFWKLTGILTAIVLTLYLLLFIAVYIMAQMAASAIQNSMPSGFPMQ